MADINEFQENNMEETLKPIRPKQDHNFDEKKIEEFRPCEFYGDCNPCDVKVKTNRFQIFGHTSVEMKNIEGMQANSKLKETVSK